MCVCGAVEMLILHSLAYVYVAPSEQSVLSYYKNHPRTRSGETSVKAMVQLLMFTVFHSSVGMLGAIISVKSIPTWRKFCAESFLFSVGHNIEWSMPWISILVKLVLGCTGSVLMMASGGLSVGIFMIFQVHLHADLPVL